MQAKPKGIFEKWCFQFSHFEVCVVDCIVGSKENLHISMGALAFVRKPLGVLDT